MQSGFSDVDTFVWFPLKLMKVANKYDNTFYFITALKGLAILCRSCFSLLIVFFQLFGFPIL